MPRLSFEINSSDVSRFIYCSREERKRFLKVVLFLGIKRDRRFTSSSTQDAASIFRQENPVAASLLHRLIEIEIEPISADFSLPEAGDELLSANAYLIKLFARLADRLLSFYVEWAKSIPGEAFLGKGRKLENIYKGYCAIKLRMAIQV